MRIQILSQKIVIKNLCKKTYIREWYILEEGRNIK